MKDRSFMNFYRRQFSALSFCRLLYFNTGKFCT